MASMAEATQGAAVSFAVGDYFSSYTSLSEKIKQYEASLVMARVWLKETRRT